MSSKGSLFVISGPSGSGKTSLANQVLKKIPNLQFSVSHTTRPPRGSESDGVEYFFISDGQFARMVQEGEFLEYAHVYGYDYGTSRQFVEETLAQGVDVLLDIDVQGALQVRERMENSTLIFVLPPSWEVLERRLTSRGSDDHSVIRRRLQIARQEVEQVGNYDYLIVNSDIESAREELYSIILASRCRMKKLRHQAEEIARTFKEKV